MKSKQLEELVQYRSELQRSVIDLSKSQTPKFVPRQVATTSFATVIEKRASKEREAPKDFKKLLPNLKKIHEFCETENQDWVFLVSGMEGAGKSTLALHLALLMDPRFEFEDQMIYSWNEEYGYLDYIKKFRHSPFRSVIFDEAICVLFSREHASGDVKDAVKVFNMNRDLKHFSFLVLPSPWSLDIDLRERRARCLFYVFQNVKNHKRYYAYYSAKKLVRISQDERLRKLWRYPKLFMNNLHPDFVESFPKLEGHYESGYLRYKRDYFNDLIATMDAKYKSRTKKK